MIIITTTIIIIINNNNNNNDNNNNNPRDQEILGWCPVGDSQPSVIMSELCLVMR